MRAIGLPALCLLALLAAAGCRGMQGVRSCKDLDVPRRRPVVATVLPCPSDDVPVAFFLCKRPADDSLAAAERELARHLRCENGCDLEFTLESERLVDEISGCMLKKGETGYAYAVTGTAACASEY